MTSRASLQSEERVRRFSLYRIIEHLVLIILFVILAGTGLPQKFYSLGVSQSLILALGGIDVVRSVHHGAGVLLGILAVQHVVVNFVGVVFLQWAPSMLISLKDPQDALHNVRYYLGLVGRPAMCGRFSYKEKCVYWLVLIGVMQMAVTGLVLWFPVAATKLFPGQFIPVSKVVHTSEAMLMFIIVVTWHIYDSVLNPEVFPLDKSIFTGYTDRKTMARRHPLELKGSEDAEAGSAARSPRKSLRRRVSIS